PGLVCLTGADLDGQRQPRPIGDEVDLGAEAAAAAPQRVVTRLVGHLGGDALFPHPGGGFVGADARAVDAPELPLDPAGGVQFTLERGEEPVPEAGTGPAAPAGVDRLPLPITRGEIAPRHARVQAEEHAVED